jgi:putative intracellular protease/amidase
VVSLLVLHVMSCLIQRLVCRDFPNAESVSSVAAAVYENGGTVGAVCHGPICYANIRLSNGELLIKGRPVCAFTNEEEEMAGMTCHLPDFQGKDKTPEDILSAVGGNYSKGPAWGSYWVGEDRVYSGQNPASAGAVAEAIIASI